MKKLLIIILFVVAIYAISWVATCGLVKILSLCFGFVFSWKLATGIWFVLLLLRWVVSAAKSDK